MKIELTLSELCEVMERKNAKAALAFSGCEKCKYYDRSASEYPCKNCARNHGDYFVRKGKNEE